MTTLIKSDASPGRRLLFIQEVSKAITMAKNVHEVKINPAMFSFEGVKQKQQHFFGFIVVNFLGD